MTIANELIKLQENLINSYQAVNDKGGEIPQDENFDNLPEAINSIQGGSGDLVFAENRMGRTPIQDEKVLLTKNTNFSESFTGNLNQSYNWSKAVINNGICYNTNSYSNYSTAYTYQNGSWSNYRVNQQNNPDNRFPSIMNKGIWYQNNINSSNFIMYDQNTLTTLLSSSPFLQLNDNLKYKGSDGKIYSNDETQSYTTGVGDIRNSQKMIQFVNNILVCFPANNTIKFIDTTNFPNCTETVYNLPNTNTYFYGVSGVNINDFAFTSTTNSLSILKLTENGYVVYDTINILNYFYATIFDVHYGMLSGLHSNYYPFIYHVSNNSFTEIEIPSTVRERVKSDLTSSTYDNLRRRNFAFDISLAYFGWGWSTGDYNNFNKFCAMGADGKWYFTEPTVQNYQNIGSFTGFVTGNIDENNNYEIKTVLPREYTVTCGVDTPQDTSFVPIISIEDI